ncbi:MAG: hypothetical protein ABFC63_05280 [Thermoguttaceae bacterium]
MSIRSQLSSLFRRGWNRTGGSCSATPSLRSALLGRRLRLEPLEDRQLLSASPTFTITAPTSGGYTVGDTVTIDWKVANLTAGGTISLCYDKDTKFGNGNETWIEVDKVVAVNGTDSYDWDTTGIAAGTYYIGGYLYSNSTPTYSHLNKSIVVRSSATTFVLTAPSSGVYAAGQTVSIQWTASNLASGSTVSLCYDVDTVFNGNETWITIDRSVSSGTSSYQWNTTGVQGGAYYIAGYVFSNNGPTYSHFAQAVTIQGTTPTFTLTSPTSGSYVSGEVVSVTWNATGLSSRSVVSLCYDTDTTFNGNEKWIVVDLSASSGSGSYSWDTTGISAGTYYIAGYAYSTYRPTYSHSSQSFTITAAPAMTFSMTAPTSGTYLAGEVVTVEWTAANVPTGSVISLCYDTDTTWWNGNEKWIKMDQSVTSGAGTYSWNTAGVPSGVYYIAGYIYALGKPTYSHLSQSFTITNTLRLATDSTTVAQTVSSSEVVANENQIAAILAEAIRRWSSSADTQSLSNIAVQVADLPGNLLAETIGNTIIIDRDAAGYGWFIDSTPQDDSEYTSSASGSLLAQSDSAADRHADLLTTVMHELGHVLGYRDVDTGLMGGTLALGVRWPSAADQVFAVFGS